MLYKLFLYGLVYNIYYFLIITISIIKYNVFLYHYG